MSIDGRLKDDVHRDPDKLVREADDARAHLDKTLEMLEHRLSPSEILHQTLDVVRENGGDFGRNLTAQVKNNPVPTLLAGLGIAWLVAADRSPHRQHAGNGSSVGHRVSSAAGAVTDRVASAAGTVEDGISSAAGTTRHAARGMVHASRSGAERVIAGSRYLRREQPLLLGALAVAAGIGIGAMLPATATEDELLGDASDSMKDRLRESGKRGVERVKTAAAEAAEAAEHAAEDAIDGEGTLPRPRPPVAPGSRPFTGDDSEIRS